VDKLRLASDSAVVLVLDEEGRCNITVHQLEAAGACVQFMDTKMRE
jgi:hypothetical protein